MIDIDSGIKQSQSKPLKTFKPKPDRPIYTIGDLHFQLSAVLTNGKVEGYMIRPVEPPKCSGYVTTSSTTVTSNS